MSERATATRSHTFPVDVVLALSSVDTETHRASVYLLKNDNGKFSVPIREITEARGVWQTAESMIYDWVILPPEAPRQIYIQSVAEIEPINLSGNRRVQIIFSFTVGSGFNHIFEDHLVKFDQDEFIELILSENAEEKFEPGHLDKAKLALIKDNHGRTSN